MKRLASTFGLRCTKSGSDGLNFFLAACVVVSFGFVTEIVLITHQGVDCWVALLIASRLAFFPLLQQWGGWGWARGWEGDTAGTAEPGWPQGYFMPCNIVLSSKKKKKKWGTRDLREVAIAGRLCISLLTGGGEWLLLLCFFHHSFAYWTAFILTQKFSPFCSSSLSPILLGLSC